MRPPAVSKPNCPPSRRRVRSSKPAALSQLDGEILEVVARGENAQRLAGEGLVRVLRRVRIFVGKAPGAGLADPARAEIVARRLQTVARKERRVDMGIDGGGQAGLRFVAGAGVVIEVDGIECPGLEGDRVVKPCARHPACRSMLST